MTDFVLVHGAWLGGWCWQRVADRLHAQGHRTFAPSLTALGDRVHLLNDDVDMETQIADITGLVTSYDLTDIVLCGHSYGGMIITAVADQLPDRVQALVYLDALVPENGQSMFDTVPQFFADTFIEQAEASGGHTVPPMTAEAFGVNEQDRVWVDEKGEDHPLKCFNQPIHLTGAYQRITNRHYVLAPAFEHPSTHGHYDQFKDDPTWQVHTLDGGHHLMVDNPDGVVKILTDI
jgi:pimeloyl-ACP methyl ester carboxylesterase